MYRLTGKIQHYAWGGTTFISELLSVPNPENKPIAEYWMGTHPGGPSQVWLNETAWTGLPELIRSDPKKYLGEKVITLFGGFPYLLKVLDVKDMLSIQVHPNKTEAEKGFARENQLGIPLQAPHRNYKDNNHKPEMMIALSEFWLLHGFSPVLQEVLDKHDIFNTLVPVLEAKGIQGLYQYVMELPQEGVDQMLKPLAEKVVPLYDAGQLSKDSPDFWAGRVLTTSKPDYKNLDRGIFSIYFFNIVHLEPGQAIFQGAGMPHAYLEGQNIELMSNSDNVLRAGLTPKHIDVPELLKHTVFEVTHPQVLNGDKKGPLLTFNCPVPDFIIHKIELDKGEAFMAHAHGPEIIIATEGDLHWQGAGELTTHKGEAVYIMPGETYTIMANSHAVLFKAAVP